MKSTVLLLSAAIVAIGCLGEAAAMPVDRGAAVSGDAALIPVVNGYGPLRYGLYGHRRHHAGRSYGTGYHGHGTRTGGPAGGLPSRN